MPDDIKQRRAKDALTSVVITVSADDSIAEALSLMQEYRVTCLPVTDEKKRCVGIVSAADLLTDAADTKAVSDVMTTLVESVGPESSIYEVAGGMLRHRVHHLPVTDHNQRLLGIISTMDVLSAFYECHGT